MNYLSVCGRFFGDAPSGSARVAWDLACLMRDAGHRVALLCGSSDSDPPPGRSVVEDVEVHRYRFLRSPKWSPRRWRHLVDAARSQAAKTLSDIAWDLIHGHLLPCTVGALAAVQSRNRFTYTVHSPVVLEQRINWSNGTATGFFKRLLGLPVLRQAERKLLQQADSVHVLSKYTLSQLSAMHGPWVEKKTAVIPWWAPAKPARGGRDFARKALGLPSAGKVFFSLRRLVRRMGLDTLVHAVGKLSSSERFVLLVAGQGPQRGALERLVANLGLQERIRFLGRVSDERLHLLYDACDVFVLPTRALECFGIIAVDALAHGRPVIGTDCGAIPEILSPILPDWIVPAGNAARLAEALRGVLTGALASPGEAALRQYAECRFGAAKLKARYRQLLERAAARITPPLAVGTAP